MNDSFGRQISYARLSVTDLCNLRCKYCMPEGVEKKSHSDILSIEQLIFISDALAELGVNKQRLTGGEPLVRRGIMNLLSHIGKNPKVSNLGITTNGVLLSQVASELKTLGVKSLNISIDTLDKNKYLLLTGADKLSCAIDGIDKALSLGFDSIKLNAVLLKGINDMDIKTLANFAKEAKVKLRFIELMPFSSQCDFAKQYFISKNEIVNSYDLHKMEKIDLLSKETDYEFSDGTPISFISPISDKFCSSCNRIRITADGKLLNCLHENREYDLIPHLQTQGELKSFIAECVQQKPKEHHLYEGSLQKRNMENIGG